MFNIGPMELIVILLVALVVVGPKRLPEIGKTIGRSLTEFRRAQEDFKKSLDFGLDDEPSSRPASAPPPEPQEPPQQPTQQPSDRTDGGE